MPQAPIIMTDHEINEASLHELLDAVRARFEVHFEPVSVDGQTFEILQISDMERYVDMLADQAGEGPLELPFWAKLWPASILLAYYTKRVDPKPGDRALEIGAGVGLAGLVAASKGFDTLISDIETDSLIFSRINILKNNLENMARVVRVDFGTEKDRDTLKDRFRLILGAEVLYIEDTYRALTKFIGRHLDTAPDAEAILSINYTRRAHGFFQRAEKEFSIQQQVMGFKASENAEDKDAERFLCALYRLTPRKISPGDAS
ncbi:class I SAM-dependent methyltransferase [Oceanidesulfovibrio indonesiensis]|nr:protein N-lysine methyltransferase family protein [Oceanidesulfovibrio indonesiensis]